MKTIRLDQNACEVAFLHSRNSRIQKLIGRPHAGYSRVEIIAGECASPLPRSVLAATVQRENTHRVSRLSQLKGQLLFFSESTQFAGAARDHLFGNLLL